MTFSKQAPSATRMLRSEHADVLTQLHTLEPDTAPNTRATVLRSICAALEIHAQIEEELFYPALRAAAIQSPALDKSASEHEAMGRLIARVRSLDDEPAAQDDALNELMNAALHHVADEETQLLPAAERFLGPERLAELGAQMVARRAELVESRAVELAGEAAHGAPVKAALVAAGMLAAAAVLVKAMRRGTVQH